MMVFDIPGSVHADASTLLCPPTPGEVKGATSSSTTLRLRPVANAVTVTNRADRTILPIADKILSDEFRWDKAMGLGACRL